MEEKKAKQIYKKDLVYALQKAFPEIKNVIGRAADEEQPAHLVIHSKYVFKGITFYLENIEIFSATKNKPPYTEELLKKALKEFPRLKREKIKKHKAWLKSPDGKKHLLNLRVERFARDTAIAHDQHGIYQSGDSIFIDVMDVTENPKELKKYHASGDILALVGISRTRTYSHSCGHSPSRRYDKYLIGLNETGTKFAHQVHTSCMTLQDAVNFIWQNQEITARHGDIAITPAKAVKTKRGVQVENRRLIDSHVFTGEFLDLNSPYVRNGIIHHEKDQHPDVVVPNSWFRILFAKRSTKGMVGTWD
jgi:ribonuclease HI